MLPPRVPLYSLTQTNRRKRVQSLENTSKPSRSAEPLVKNFSQDSGLTVCLTSRSPSPELEEAIQSIDECFKDVFRRHGELLTVTDVGRPHTFSCTPATAILRRSVENACIRKGYESEIMLQHKSALHMSSQGVPNTLRKTCFDILERIECKKLERQLCRLEKQRKRLTND